MIILISLSILKKLSNNLIEIHSQFSEQGLLNSNNHLYTLDEFGNYSDLKIKNKKILAGISRLKKKHLKIKKMN